MTNRSDERQSADGALSRRLASLGALPVDTSALEKAIRRKIPPPRPNTPHWLRSLSAVAASVVLIAAFAFGLMQDRPAQASPQLMARMYHDIVSGKIQTMPAQSMDDVNRAIAALAGAAITLPQPPPSQLMACCMQNIGNRKVACVLLQKGSDPVTMVVANEADVESPPTPTIARAGRSYHVQSVDGLQMVMTRRDHHWVCLMSRMPQEKLMDLADAIHF